MAFASILRLERQEARTALPAWPTKTWWARTRLPCGVSPESMPSKDLRTFVTKRKISGGTMSRNGRVARDGVRTRLVRHRAFSRRCEPQDRYSVPTTGR